jgi:hypothetical protein
VSNGGTSVISLTNLSAKIKSQNEHTLKTGTEEGEGVYVTRSGEEKATPQSTVFIVTGLTKPCHFTHKQRRQVNGTHVNTEVNIYYFILVLKNQRKVS